MIGHQQLDAVLPLKFNDYKRFRILRTSFKKFMKDLGKLFIIVPDKEVEICGVYSAPNAGDYKPEDYKYVGEITEQDKKLKQ